MLKIRQEFTHRPTRSWAAASTATGLLVLAFTGCATQDQSPLYVLNDANNTRLKSIYGTAQKLEERIAAAAGDSTLRNSVLNDLILMVDLDYYARERRMYRAKSGFDLGSDATLLGLSGATALVNSTSVANILGQISTGIVGLKSKIDIDILQQNTVPALTGKMRAGRSAQLARMQAAMTKEIGNGKIGREPSSIDDYSIERGLIDVNEYYAAGTVIGALQDITQKSSEEQAEAESKMDKLKPNSKLIEKTPELPGGT